MAQRSAPTPQNRDLDLSSWRIVDAEEYGATVDALRDGRLTRPAPTIGQRDDGQGLLYCGRVHSVVGASGSGKTWLVLHVALQHLRASLSHGVVYIDFEDNLAGILGRYLDLGATDAELAGFQYVHPDGPYTPEIEERFIDDIGYAADTEGDLLVIIDSAGAALALDGLNQNLDEDYSAWFRRLPTAITNLGSTVLLVDHISRGDERGGDGLHAIGSQRKRAAITGAQYMMRLTKPFAQGHDGAGRVVCAKDRGGTYRQGEKVADFTVTAHADGTLRTHLVAPDADATFRPTVLMERISRHVELHPGESKRTILDAVTGNKVAKVTALDVLIAEGYVAIEQHGQTHEHTSLRPFREDESQ